MLLKMLSAECQQFYLGLNILSKVFLLSSSHHLNQCCLVIIQAVMWHSTDGNFTENVKNVNHKNVFENHTFRITATSPKGQWINASPIGGHMVTMAPCKSIVRGDKAIECMAPSRDSFTVSLHSLNSRQMPAVKAVQGDCQWPLENGGNSHQLHEPIMHCGIRQY